MGLDGEPPPACDDADEAYMAPGSVVRRLHADLPSMLIGGLSSLLLQSLHPLAMAGVAQHSRYREDPLGRLERTATFVGTTTFRSKDEAAAIIKRVRRIHASVDGTAPDGRRYRASDPDLLAWVHVAEVRSFLAASIAFGPTRWSADEQDDYVAQMAPVAMDLGAVDVPRSVAAIDRFLDDVRPELCLTDEARDVRRFVMLGVRRLPHEMAAYSILVAAAQATLPGWARSMLRLPSVPGVDLMAIRPAAKVLSRAIRLVVPTP